MKAAIVLIAIILMAAPAQAQQSNLVTIKTQATLTDTEGRSIASARQHHQIVDAPQPLGGPNEEVNPIEVLLSALGTCGVLVSERLADEQAIPLDQAVASVEGDLDPSGVRGQGGDPRIQVFRVDLKLTGPSPTQAKAFASAFEARCPIYATLSRAAPIEVSVRTADQ